MPCAWELQDLVGAVLTEKLQLRVIFIVSQVQTLWTLDSWSWATISWPGYREATDLKQHRIVLATLHQPSLHDC